MARSKLKGIHDTSLKFKAVFVVKMVRDLSPSVLHFYSKLKLETLFYFKPCIKTC